MSVETNTNTKEIHSQTAQKELLAWLARSAKDWEPLDPKDLNNAINWVKEQVAWNIEFRNDLWLVWSEVAKLSPENTISLEYIFNQFLTAPKIA